MWRSGRTTVETIRQPMKARSPASFATKAQAAHRSIMSPVSAGREIVTIKLTLAGRVLLDREFLNGHGLLAVSDAHNMQTAQPARRLNSPASDRRSSTRREFGRA